MAMNRRTERDKVFVATIVNIPSVIGMERQHFPWQSLQYVIIDPHNGFISWSQDGATIKEDGIREGLLQSSWWICCR
jgi:hypothetical protein